MTKEEENEEDLEMDNNDDTFANYWEWLLIIDYWQARRWSLWKRLWQWFDDFPGLAYMAALCSYRGSLNPARALGPAFVANRFVMEMSTC